MRQPREYIGSMSSPAFLTAEELLHLNLPNKRTELVRGVLVVREPAGYQHGDVAMRLGAAIHAHVEAHRLGRAFAAETGFTLARKPDTVLEKVADWLKAGTRLVWVVDPIRLNARVYRADGSESWLNETDALQGEDVLPAFTCPLRSVLRRETHN